MKTEKQKTRLFYLDNLKVILTVLVIIHHVGQAYGPTGGYWDFQSIYRIPLLDPFFTINASFFMSLFFFISAYFMPSSLEKYGSRKFIKERLIRYGIPILFGFLVIVPLDQYISFIKWRGGPPISFLSYITRAYFNFGEKPFAIKSPSWPELNFGHLWFLQHLLVYALLLVLARWIAALFKKTGSPTKINRFTPGLGSILFYSVIAGYLTGIVRIFYPLDHWYPFLYLIQVEPAHLVSYVFSFLAGLWAVRFHWLDQITKKVGWILFLIGFSLSLFLVIIFLTHNQILKNWFDDTRFLYETVMGLSISFGLVILSRSFLNFTSSLWQFLSHNAYGAYIFHVPVLIFFQATLEKFPPFQPIAKFLLVSLLSVVSSFTVSYLIRLIPGVKRVI